VNQASTRGSAAAGMTKPEAGLHGTEISSNKTPSWQKS